MNFIFNLVFDLKNFNDFIFDLWENPKKSDFFPHSLSTALFSFLYHLSSYDNGAEALVNSGMIESLLKVIRLIGDQQDQIMFVTRAVRIVDLVTNVDMQSFQKMKGFDFFDLDRY